MSRPGLGGKLSGYRRFLVAEDYPTAAGGARELVVNHEVLGPYGTRAAAEAAGPSRPLAARVAAGASGT